MHIDTRNSAQKTGAGNPKPPQPLFPESPQPLFPKPPQPLFPESPNPKQCPQTQGIEETKLALGALAAASRTYRSRVSGLGV